MCLRAGESARGLGPGFDIRPVPDLGGPEANDGLGEVRVALLPDVDDVLVAEREAMRDLGGTHEEIHVGSSAHDGGTYASGQRRARCLIEDSITRYC